MAKVKQVNKFSPKTKKGKNSYKKNLNKSEKRSFKEYQGQGR